LKFGKFLPKKKTLAQLESNTKVEVLISLCFLTPKEIENEE
jgi:hypothetical protein